jgi:adenylosuccinate lyase
MRQGRADNDLFDRLAADPRLGLDRAAMAALSAESVEFTGAARPQTRSVVRRVEALVARHPDAAAYAPAAIL